MLRHLATRRTILWPTAAGWLVLGIFVAAGVAGLQLGVERFLAHTNRERAEVLVLEAWTQDGGAKAAAEEFLKYQDSYRFVVATGALTGTRWSSRRWREVEIADRVMRSSGVPGDSILAAELPDIETQRTFVAALATKAALQERGIRPAAINVLTRGAHARRSRLTFARVFGPETKVGVISWQPWGSDSVTWWRSSERSIDVLKESAGYLYEALLRSGRFWPGSASISLSEYRKASAHRRI